MRTGDTPQKERALFRRHPAEILITTPESLYLLLTSDAAASLRGVDAVIVDEIHAAGAGSQRGAHLAPVAGTLAGDYGAALFQRIGLSATQRPLEEVAHFLAGAEGAVCRRCLLKELEHAEQKLRTELEQEMEARLYA